MRYFGSKASVIEQLYSLVSKKAPEGSFCDPFGGIATIGSYFKDKNYEVYSGDQLTFAHFFQVARIAQNSPPKFNTLCDELKLENYHEIVNFLNGLECKNGWLVKNYVHQRKFFTPQNGGKIEACWQTIKSWNEKGWLNYDENAILTSSLINNMDKVANTAGTYYAYLKDWYRKALRPFYFDLLEYTRGNPNCKCFLCDATNLVERYKFDILYLDPPYNERSYASYYHLPETIALNETPSVQGKAGVPCTQYPRSAFNRRNDALNALKDLLNAANFRLLVFHYSDEGIIPSNELRELFNKFGSVDEYILEGDGYTNKSKSRKIKHRIYLVDSRC